MSSIKGRNWCYTLNNYSEAEVNYLHEFECKYHIFGYEIAPMTETPHIQGYIEFKEPIRFSQITKLIPRAHIELRKGTAEEAIKYCKKDGKYVETGKAPVGQGTRSDLAIVAEKVIKGTFDPCDHPETFIKYHKGIEKLSEAVTKHRTEPPRVYWFWGLAGTGKTRSAVDVCGIPFTYIKDGTIWWNGYDATTHRSIVIDDFDGHWQFRDLLRLLDRYPYQGQYKGGYVKINSEFIIITCEFPPSKFWGGNDLAQISRRLSEVREIKNFTHPQISPRADLLTS